MVTVWVFWAQQIARRVVQISLDLLAAAAQAVGVKIKGLVQCRFGNHLQRLFVAQAAGFDDQRAGEVIVAAVDNVDLHRDGAVTGRLHGHARRHLVQVEHLERRADRAADDLGAADA